MPLQETSQGVSYCSICGNSNVLTMWLYSSVKKDHDSDADPETDHYVCGDCSSDGLAAERGWRFVR